MTRGKMRKKSGSFLSVSVCRTSSRRSDGFFFLDLRSITTTTTTRSITVESKSIDTRSDSLSVIFFRYSEEETHSWVNNVDCGRNLLLNESYLKILCDIPNKQQQYHVEQYWKMSATNAGDRFRGNGCMRNASTSTFLCANILFESSFEIL